MIISKTQKTEITIIKADNAGELIQIAALRGLDVNKVDASTWIIGNNNGTIKHDSNGENYWFVMVIDNACLNEENTIETTFQYAPINRPAQEAAPEGYVIVSTERTEFTPYGIIAYTRKLTAMEAYKYELRNLKTDYAIGAQVAYVMGGKVYEGVITSFEKNCAYVDDYELLPLWRLHEVS
jgi:hypothetical protein